MMKSFNLLVVISLLLIGASCKTPTQPVSNQPNVICNCDYGNLSYSKSTNYLWAPNSFTPNGDGLNDVFQLKSKGIDTLHFAMAIYDPNQKMIYSTTDIHAAWTGPTTYTSGNYPVIAIYEKGDGSQVETRFCLYILPQDTVNHCFKTGGATGLIFADQFDPTTVSPAFTTNENLCN